MILTLVIFTLIIPSSYAQTGISTIKVADKRFDISYVVDATVLKVDLDKESRSILIGLDKTKESNLEITFPSEMLNAKKGDFVVLVDGFETNYHIKIDNGKNTISVEIPENTEEVEIIGTSVVPEFPTGPVAMLIMISILMIVFLKLKITIFR